MIVAPSFLTADFTKLESEIKSLARAEWLHFDVMDGIFVPNRTYDEKIVAEVKNYSSQFFDCHLMVQNPGERIKAFVASGADLVTFHLEAADNETEALIGSIKNSGVKVGISIKPATEVKALLPYLGLIDLVLVMSVEPGKGGQQFLPEAIDKITFLAEERKKQGHEFLIEVDGGINSETAKTVRKAGADVIVVGSYLINHKHREKLIEELQNA